MTSTTKRVFATLLTVAFVALAVSFFWGRREEFAALEWPSPVVTGIVAVAFVINLILRSIYNFYTVRRLGTWISPAETFMLSTIATAANFLIPARAGAGFRALYMKSVHGFPLSSMASAMLLFVVINLIVVSLAAVLLILVFGGRGDTDFQLLVFFPAIMLLMIGSLLIFRGGRVGGNDATWHGVFRERLGHMINERRLMVVAFVVVALNFLISSLAWMAALTEYAPSMPASDAFVLAASQIIAGVITITPGAAGFQELAGLYVGRSIPITAVELFAVLLWVRVVRTLIAVLLAVPSIFVLRHRIAEAVPSNLDGPAIARGNKR